MYEQKSYDNNPKLYIIPTPIGNMEDITIRALKILTEVDIIFAEDTRTSSKLLKHYDIHKKLMSNHLYNEDKTQEKIINYLKEGKNIAIISDAGTPVISDPGYTIVNKAITEKYNVICLPGATAIIPAIVMSGLAGGPFTYYGFLNSKESKRKKELELLQKNKYPLVFYEAPHRIKQTLININEILGNRKIAIVREISKKHEGVIRDYVENIIKTVENLKGEIVLVVEGNSEEAKYDNLPIIKHINLYMEDGLSANEAIKKVAKERKISKSEVYQEYVNNK